MAECFQEKIGNYEENELTLFLEKISGITSFKKWYFGHYHKDMDIDEKYTAVFDRLIKL